MTMQMLDSFSYRGKRAEAVAISHRFSFTPGNCFGVETAAWGTANYRGFWCDYTIDELFVVSNLYLFSKSHVYPSINGKNAEEVPEFVRILEKTRRTSRTERQYITDFPMQYRGIDHLFEYSGKIVLGIEQEKNQSGKERYREVKELHFDSGTLTDMVDITALWKEVCEKPKGQPYEYWWEKKDNNYFDLMNYAFMGVRSDPDG